MAKAAVFFLMLKSNLFYFTNNSFKENENYGLSNWKYNHTIILQYVMWPKISITAQYGNKFIKATVNPKGMKMFSVPNNNLIFFSVSLSLTLIPKLCRKGVAPCYLKFTTYLTLFKFWYDCIFRA